MIALVASASASVGNLVFAQVGDGSTPNPGGPAVAPTVAGRAADTPFVTTPDVAWRALLPLIILALGALLLLTISSLLRRKPPVGFYATSTVVVALLAMASLVPLWARVQGWDHIWWWDLDVGAAGPFSTMGSSCGVTGPSCGVVGIDGFSIAITFAICVAILLTALLASDYLRREGLEGPELYVLMLLAGAGGVVMAMANDLIIVFLGLETLSIAVYVLAAMHRKRWQSQEAGLKYFVLGGFSSAFFLYGVAMIYGATGTTNLVNIKNLLAQNIAAPIPSSISAVSWTLNSPLLLLGIGLMLIGLGFKVAAVPFHFWSPDVYDGSPSPVVAFMASGVKAAGFAALVRVFVLGFQTYTGDWRPVVGVLAGLSMVVGSVLAINQTSVKRTLAYSSINHAGFILMALAASSNEGNSAIVFYIVAYTFMVVGSFAIVSLVARRGDGRTTLDDYKGLAESNPLLALVFAIFLFAQSGVPFTSGFVAKLYTVIASVQAGATWLAIIAVLSSVIATYLYLRIVVSMYMSGSVEDGTMPEPLPSARIRIPFAAGLAILICFVVTLGAGIFPGPLTDFANESKPALVEVATQPAAVGALGPDGTPVTTLPTPAAAAASSAGASSGASSSGSGGAASSGAEGATTP